MFGATQVKSNAAKGDVKGIFKCNEAVLSGSDSNGGDAGSNIPLIIVAVVAAVCVAAAGITVIILKRRYRRKVYITENPSAPDGHLYEDIELVTQSTAQPRPRWDAHLYAVNCDVTSTYMVPSTSRDRPALVDLTPHAGEPQYEAPMMAMNVEGNC